ncbi:MaoC family dehydratase N-terminal domain-containing protein [Rhodococcus indonesiensis]|uniref:FAS1-like dehydratase domain-containing protein n=1 Tax=Rhodococcus indonesiensis TaxID=3055869 RepID=UPI0039F6B28E
MTTDTESATPTFDIHIEYGKIREFARATMATDPAYAETDAVVPPTFLTTSGFFWQTAESKKNAAHHLDPQRTLHAQQEYVFHGEPPRAGQVLTASARVANRYEKQGRRGGSLTFVDMVIEFRDPNGRLVAEQRSTAVQTAHAPKES